MPRKLKRPIQWKQDKRPGYDFVAKRYRTASGKLITKQDYEALIGTHEEIPYGIVQYAPENTLSTVMAAIDRIVGGLQSGKMSLDDKTLTAASGKYNMLLAAIDNSGYQQAQSMPSDIRAAMSLSEYYDRNYGDVHQHTRTPIELAMGELIIEGGDEGVRNALKALYGTEGEPGRVNMRHALEQIWMAVSNYGSAYPLEVQGEEGEAIVQLPPKHMWVGYTMDTGSTLLPEGLNPVKKENVVGPYRFNSPTTEAWTEELVSKSIMPMAYSAFGPHWNEQIARGWGIPIDPNNLHPVRDFAPDWQRFPIPGLTRAFRALAQRAIWDEMTQATIEGFKNQLWVFILGDKDKPPSLAEVLAFKEALLQAASDRTGSLVWKAPLEVKQYAPSTLQNALSPEIRQGMTLEVYRNIGANVRLITGNTAQTGDRGAEGFEIDLGILLRRLDYIRTQLLVWEKGYRVRWALRKGDKNLVEAVKKIKVRFSRSLMEIASIVESEIRPLYSIGLLSPQTALDRTGYNYGQELSNKEAHEPNKEKFAPPPTFNQIAPNGEVPSATPLLQEGRPSKNDVASATWEDDEDRKKMLVDILAAIAAMWESQDPQTFINRLQAINNDYLGRITQAAYKRAGGVGTVPDGVKRFAADFVNSFAPGFVTTLVEELEREGQIAEGKWALRASQYGVEGYKMAVFGGTNQAMSERGAKFWRRILHPAGSKSGPCMLCVADSQIRHEMSEPFIVMHPNEACTAQELGVQYTTATDYLEVPVPNFFTEIDDILRAAGVTGERIVRRRRTE